MDPVIKLIFLREIRSADCEIKNRNLQSGSGSAETRTEKKGQFADP